MSYKSSSVVIKSELLEKKEIVKTLLLNFKMTWVHLEQIAHITDSTYETGWNDDNIVS